MTRSFAAGAARLAGLAGRMIGWRPEEFWRATPAELAAILDTGTPPAAPPSRAEIERLMERDNG